MKRTKRNLLITSAALIILLAALCTYLLGFYLPKRRERDETEKMIREYYAAKLETYREENEKYDDYEVDVAFIGDSLTDGYDLKTYYPDLLTANRGIGGETTHGLEDRLGISLYELKPKVAVMLIGGNNLDTMLDNYESILIGIRDNLPETKVILLSLTSMGKTLAEKNKIAAYNNVTVKKLADKYGFAYVDLYTPLFDEVTGEINSLYTTDGAHLTHEGYTVFTSTVTPAIVAALAEYEAGRKAP